MLIFGFTLGGPVAKSRLCPYLDTISRTVLDFDFEKLCSVSLTRINVYACLVCGKYFQGNPENMLLNFITSNCIEFLYYQGEVLAHMLTFTVLVKDIMFS